MRWRVAIFLAVPASLFSLSGLSAQILVETPSEPLRLRIDKSSCPNQGDPDEITVCGRRDDQERYRLPLRDQVGSTSGPARGEVPRASAEANPTAPCGIYEGERRCSKAEMKQYGYYGGRDPFTAVSRIAEAVVDPD